VVLQIVNPNDLKGRRKGYLSQKVFRTKEGSIEAESKTRATGLFANLAKEKKTSEKENCPGKPREVPVKTKRRKGGTRGGETNRLGTD